MGSRRRTPLTLEPLAPNAPPEPPRNGIPPVACPASTDPAILAVRQRIDAIDDQLLLLLEQRAAEARTVAQLKRERSLPMHDPERESQLLARLEATVDANPASVFPKRSVRSVFREIMSACLSVEHPIVTAYFGPPGTFTHMAALSAFGFGAQYMEAATIPGVFDAVSRGRATYGVVPIENSTEGSVTYTLDVLLETDLQIRQELVLDISQCLVGTNVDLGGIKRVYSHPQPIAQCRDWLAKNLPRAQIVVSESTTAAARQAAEDSQSAAIAGRLAAELVGLHVIREGIQDQPLNATRFIVLGKVDTAPTGRDKTTIVFSTRDERGALRKVLDIFDTEGINLTRIESRPARSRLWEYFFITDLEGHRSDEQVARALSRLHEACQMTRVLGSYPRAQ